jgi:hypothetical protein
MLKSVGYVPTDLKNHKFPCLRCMPSKWNHPPTHPRWPEQAEEVIDEALRPFLVSLVARRAALLGAASVDSSLDPLDDESNNEETN